MVVRPPGPRRRPRPHHPLPALCWRRAHRWRRADGVAAAVHAQPTELSCACPSRHRTRARPRSSTPAAPERQRCPHKASPERHSTASSRVSAHRRAPLRRLGTSRTPVKTKKVLEGSLRHTTPLGHEKIGTEHLLLALLDDPASTGAGDPHRARILSIGEMHEHLRRELAQQPTPGPPTASPSGSTPTNTPAPTLPAGPHRRPDPRHLRSTTASPTPSNNPDSRFSRA
ncbi:MULTISPECIES: Clp protease N-terminal domain-containing protein [unclassified Rhodococcus (in: high G+C Gram-positive bacteria)]|uniref:Clp protease N-terminal domain-containing protein n=1 Tax=unclassified Rhodococcus (in: high G+C Gram-positive bacteria) TaxID=192944 RepID=UPI00313FFDC1